jgi:outer membrane protein assembly factor BamB
MMTGTVAGRPRSRNLQRLAMAGLMALLAACSGTGDKPKPQELAPNVALLGVRQAWSLRLPAGVDFPLQMAASPGQVTVASSDGAVIALESGSGRELWRAQAGEPLTAGVGSDGRVAAVVTRANTLVAVEEGRVLWRQPLAAQVFTAPLVAGQRVFVLGADRSLAAFDGRSGRRLWTLQRPGEPLVLRQSGVLMAVGDTLVTGFSGRLVGINPGNGSVRWEAPIATPRGINDVERLVDLVSGVSRQGGSVCVRAFQAGVGCVDATRGAVQWTRPAQGGQGLTGDDRVIYGAESDGRLVAWRRSDGERLWSDERLRFRGLGSPLLAGRSLIVGDAGGLLHVLSREDGSPLNRVPTDGSAIVNAPLLAGETLVVATRAGGVFAFRPE